jgi:hypothetical protein
LHFVARLRTVREVRSAATLEGYAINIILRHGLTLEQHESKVHAPLAPDLRGALAPNEGERLAAEGAKFSPLEATALALGGNV